MDNENRGTCFTWHCVHRKCERNHKWLTVTFHIFDAIYTWEWSWSHLLFSSIHISLATQCRLSTKHMTTHHLGVSSQKCLNDSKSLSKSLKVSGLGNRLQIQSREIFSWQNWKIYSERKIQWVWKKVLWARFEADWFMYPDRLIIFTIAEGFESLIEPLVDDAPYSPS